MVWVKAFCFLIGRREKLFGPIGTQYIYNSAGIYPPEMFPYRFVFDLLKKLGVPTKAPDPEV